MSQLIGLPCAICDRRIDTVLDGMFCEACGCPVHRGCARTRQSGPASCGSCGASPEVIDAHRRRSRREEAAFRHGYKTHRLAWGIAETAGGLVCLAFGVVTVLPVAKPVILASGGALVLHGVTLLCRTEPRGPKDT